MDTRDIDLSHRVVPDGCIDILFEWTPLGARCRAIGPMTRHIQKCYTLPTREPGVRFVPSGANEFFEQPIHLFTNQAHRIDRLWRDCRPICSILDSSGIDEQTIRELNELLLRKQRNQDGQTAGRERRAASANSAELFCPHGNVRTKAVPEQTEDLDVRGQPGEYAFHLLVVDR